MVKHGDSGVITLSDFVKATDLPVEDRIEFLKSVTGGDFIEGRQGHPSRFVFGKALEKWKHKEAYRREWRIKNGRDPETGRLLR